MKKLAVALSATAAVAVTGCSSTGSGGTPAAGAPAATTSAVTPAATTSAGSPPSPSAARTIPASAFFAMPADMRRERRKAEGSAAVPKLCGGELAAGKGVVASAAMMSIYQSPDAPEGSVPHGILYQTIRSYDGAGAAAFMDRARDGLADCTSYRTAENTVRVRTKPLSGAADEGLTVDLVQPQLDLPGEPTGGTQTNRVVVLRFGSVVTILNDTEYERSSSDPELVDVFVEEAAEAIRGWRG
ncbi:hypothetical protein [Actinoplanes sp. URMC 104]|uniref:hypothetical protein n=1 Tax=Actinoplanes sp. URMC 104 TaxID=3423409 RepID=UPI003F1BCCFD